MIIPDQKMTYGVIQMNIIEGKLTAIDITGNKRLSTDYIKEDWLGGDALGATVNSSVPDGQSLS